MFKELPADTDEVKEYKFEFYAQGQMYEIVVDDTVPVF